VPVVGPRCLIEAGFIVAVAVIAGIARLATVWIVAVMAGAWLIVAAVEITVSRRRARERGQPALVPVRPPEPTAPAPALPPSVVVPREPRPEIPREPPPKVERPAIVEPEPEPEPERVVAFSTGNDGPRAWNLWELERAASDNASEDVARNEERAYLLMYLREFAGPDGVLPADFDGLVRDAFGDVLHTVRT
jgi:hypothetical protein